MRLAWASTGRKLGTTTAAHGCVRLAPAIRWETVSTQRAYECAVVRTVHCTRSWKMTRIYTVTVFTNVRVYSGSQCTRSRLAACPRPAQAPSWLTETIPPGPSPLSQLPGLLTPLSRPSLLPCFLGKQRPQVASPGRLRDGPRTTSTDPAPCADPCAVPRAAGQGEPGRCSGDPGPAGGPAGRRATCGAWEASGRRPRTCTPEGPWGRWRGGEEGMRSRGAGHSGEGVAAAEGRRKSPPHAASATATGRRDRSEFGRPGPDGSHT